MTSRRDPSPLLHRAHIQHSFLGNDLRRETGSFVLFCVCFFVSREIKRSRCSHIRSRLLASFPICLCLWRPLQARLPARVQGRGARKKKKKKQNWVNTSKLCSHERVLRMQKKDQKKNQHRKCTHTDERERSRERGWLGGCRGACHTQSCSELTSGPCLVLFLEKEIKNKNPNNSFSFRSASSRYARWRSEDKEAGWGRIEMRDERVRSPPADSSHTLRGIFKSARQKSEPNNEGRQDCLMILEAPINNCDSLWCASLRYAC